MLAEETTAEETTAEETTAEETTAQDQDSDTAADGSCANPDELVSIGPTTENTVSPFRTTGRTFLVSYEVQFEDPQDFYLVEFDIEDRLGLVDFSNVSRNGPGSFIVTEGAGSYELVVNVSPANGATYTVTVSDCGATGSNPDPPKEDPPQGKKPPGFIEGSDPKEPLPNTGGFPLFLGAGSMLLAATVLGSRVIGRR